MASAFDQWEKDPFFRAAEEVQESADRMESVYRRWMHDNQRIELRKELRIALGTAKWQLEELEMAVRRDDEAVSAREATVTRHSDFVEAISDRVGMVEKSLKESNVEEEEEEESGLMWARLDKGERDELTLFLSCSSSKGEEAPLILSDGETSDGLKNSPYKLNAFSLGLKDHCRIAGGIAEVGLLVDSVSTEGSPLRLPDEQCSLPPPRLSSLFELRTAESSSKPKKWYKNGFRKWKDLSQDIEESLPLRNHHLSRGMNECYERSKRCISDCTDESYHKNHHDWFGAFQRQLQRSQYQIQYGRPLQMMIWITVTVLLLSGSAFGEFLAIPPYLLHSPADGEAFLNLWYDSTAKGAPSTSLTAHGSSIFPPPFPPIPSTTSPLSQQILFSLFLSQPNPTCDPSTSSQPLITSTFIFPFF